MICFILFDPTPEDRTEERSSWVAFSVHMACGGGIIYGDKHFLALLERLE